MKTCNHCKTNKEEHLFNKDKNRKDGLYPNCIECRKIESKKYQLKHSDDIKKYRKVYRETNFVKILYDQIKNKCLKKNLKFDLEENDLVIPDKCPVLGIPIFIKSGLGRHDNTPSVDRIDNLMGYTKDNIIIVSWRANNIKGYATIEELEKIAKFYAQFKKTPVDGN